VIVALLLAALLAAPALSANVNETVDPRQFTVEGDQGRADDDGA